MSSSLKEKIKYDSEYISYIQNGESAAVFITRDVVESISTKGKWIDVLSTDGQQTEEGRWNFESFLVELFPRKTHPVYPEDAPDEVKKYITWKTAHTDIENLRREGYKGVKFKIYPKLVNLNRGKYKITRAVWNRTFERWVPKKWFTSSCEWRERKIPIESEWKYHILKIQRL